MKRILLISRDPRQWLQADQLDKSSFYKSYNNTGNLVWNYAIAKALHHPENEVIHNTLSLTRQSAEKVNANFDHVVFSFANLIDPARKWRFEQLNRFVPFLKLPITVCSLGAQAKLTEGLSFIDPIRDDAKRLFGHFADRNHSIGVRGSFTADILTELGFGASVNAIGCPSFYVQGEDFQASPPRRWDESSIAIFSDNDHSRPTLYSCANSVFRDQFEYVTQDFVCKDSCADETLLELVRLRKLHIFTTFHDWKAFLKTASLSISSRIHGSVVAMHADLPVLIASIDRRTEELAEHIGFSRISLSKIVNARSPEDLIQNIDTLHLNRTYQTRLPEFLKFLQDNSLTHWLAPGTHEPLTYYDKVILPERTLSGPHQTLVDFGESHLLYQKPSVHLKKMQRRAALRARLKRVRTLLPF